jgi:hypothetical protein
VSGVGVPRVLRLSFVIIYFSCTALKICQHPFKGAFFGITSGSVSVVDTLVKKAREIAEMDRIGGDEINISSNSSLVLAMPNIR